MEDARKGQIDLTIGAAKVWIKLVRVTRATTRLKVSARKHRLPDLELAQALYVWIIEDAAE